MHLKLLASRERDRGEDRRKIEVRNGGHNCVVEGWMPTSPVVFQAKANLQLYFCELAEVVGSFCLVHALQQLGLQVGHKEGHC